MGLCDKIASAIWLEDSDYTIKVCAESGYNRKGVEVKPHHDGWMPLGSQCPLE